MKFRFVDKHDPVALRRRRLQAQRTKKCRQRQKTKQHIETLNYEAQTSHTVDSASENVQMRPGNGSLADIGEIEPDTISSGELPIASSQEDDDLSLIDTEPDYYDEEIVDAHSTEEREHQTEPGSPDVFTGIQVGLPHDNARNDLI